MNFSRLLRQGRLKRHKTSKKEIQSLLRIAERDIADARVKGLSADRKFATAYSAVLQLAIITLYCEGYRPAGMGHHFTVFQTLRETMGPQFHELVDYFDACRIKRNITDYDRAGEISTKEAAELLREAKKFKREVLRWVGQNYPEYLAN